MRSTNPEYSKTLNLYIETAKTFNRLNEQSIYVFDSHIRKFVYMAENSLFLCGYNVNLVKEWGYNFFFSHTPRAEVDILQTIYRAGKEFFRALPAAEKTCCSISHNFNLEFRNKKMLVNHKVTPLLLDEKGQEWLVLGIMSMASGHSVGQAQIRNDTTKESYVYNFGRAEWLNKEQLLLTDREKEIIMLSAQGMTNKDIAKEVHLSEAAIKFHKTKLFKKLEVNNIAEAIGYFINYVKL
ncbi:LuxR C-terminal-related transcriptional regulator [Niabella sp.]|uniref:response regulator transcription factor n=1 Tax=Niabella sp. TaxID=1962976 RepID=UPI00261197D5|nr:LuxR C-terminal-related transcriptional regulator [Niabella sp.]